MTALRPFFLLVALLCALNSASAETVRERMKSDPKFHLYAPIFGITIDANSKIDGFRVEKVIDPKSGTTDPVDIKIPKKFIELARKKLAAIKKYEPKFKEGKPVESFTYVYYSPEYPDVVVLDLDLPIDKQP